MATMMPERQVNLVRDSEALQAVLRKHHASQEPPFREFRSPNLWFEQLNWSEQSPHRIKVLRSDENTPPPDVHTVTEIVRPVWAIAAMCAAMSALTAFVCLFVTGNLPVLLGIFLATFAVGLGISSVGMLATANERVATE